MFVFKFIAGLFLIFLSPLGILAEVSQKPLPLLRIETKNRIVVPRNKRKLPASFQLLEEPDKKDFSCKTSGEWTNLPDVRPINVRVRGNITRYYPKKGYQVDFLESAGTDDELSLSLLGLSATDKWPLIGPYFDRSLARNALALELGSKIRDENGKPVWYVPKYRFVELMINCNYLGLYTLVEKIERGKERLNLDKFDRDNPEKSPFLVKRDGKGFGSTPMVGETFTTPYYGTRLSFVYPSDNKMRDLKKEDPEKYKRVVKAMATSIDNMEKVLAKITRRKPLDDQWEKLIDVPSFVYYILSQEVYKNIDGFRRSVFLYKDKDGKIHMGPLWDFDTGLGNLWFYGQANPTGWQHGHRKYLDGNTELFWFRRLLNSKKFATEVVKTYKRLRQKGEAYHWETVEGTLDHLEASMTPEAIKRNFRRWPVLGKPSLIVPLVPPPWPRTHHGEMNKLKRWMKKRLEWMDRRIDSLAD